MVVASIATAVIAWKHIDPVIVTSTQGEIRPGDNMAPKTSPKSALAPAMQGRNHAATPADQIRVDQVSKKACGPVLARAGGGADPGRQVRDRVVERTPLGQQLADLAVGVHHGGVITASEQLPDFRKRQLGQLPA